MIVSLYSNSGFNSMNIPDSPALLPEPTLTKQSVDCVQNRFLTSVNISCVNFAQVRDVDYCMVQDGDDIFYYFVNGITMVAHDVCQLSLVPDFITSVGGVSKIKVLDGITNRIHTPSDNWGEWDEDDPYMSCNQPLEIEFSNWLFDNGTGDSSTFILCTVNLEDIAQTEGAFPATTYTDSTSGESVVVPMLIQLDSTTNYKLTMDSEKSTHIEGTKLYIVSGTPIAQKGITIIRSLGAENSITNQYEIPSIL